MSTATMTRKKARFVTLNDGQVVLMRTAHADRWELVNGRFKAVNVHMLPIHDSVGRGLAVRRSQI